VVQDINVELRENAVQLRIASAEMLAAGHVAELANP
jgi:hypothetical protein